MADKIKIIDDNDGHLSFSVGASQLVKHRYNKRGDITKIANKMGLPPSYLSDLIRGKRNWSASTMARFSKVLGFAVADIYSMGFDYAITGKFFPYAGIVRNSPEYSKDRAIKIASCVIKDLKLVLKPENHVMEGLLNIFSPLALKAYLAKKTSDGDFYENFTKALQSVLKNYTLK